MKKNLLRVTIIMLILNLVGCASDNIDNVLSGSSKNFTVAVSIIPQETFVKAVGGEYVNVVTMIPPGHSPTNYQPTPIQMTKFSDAEIYFSIGVQTEEANILPKAKELNENMRIVSISEKVGDVYPHLIFDEDHDKIHNDEVEIDIEEHEHHHSGIDPHIWLSPKRVKVMIEIIKNELIEIDPEHKVIYQQNASNYIGKLDELDRNMKTILSGLENKSFIIYHPAFAYFADDYELDMLTIESEGKQATAKKLQEVIEFAKQKNIKFVFYQEEFDGQQAETIAKEIGGITVKVAPLAPNYIENMSLIGEKFKEVMK